MRDQLWRTVYILVLLTGCARQNATALSPAPSAPTQAGAAANSRTVLGQNGVEGELVGTPARGSKFARLRIGMTIREVEATIGHSTDEDSHITGKQFIQFYFGGDTQRREAFYKGEGILTFSPSHFAGEANVLIRIIADRSETGYAH